MSIPNHGKFYCDVLKTLEERGVLKKDSRILVVCGGLLDKSVLESLGFFDVTITNLDERQKTLGGSGFAPFKWDFQDLETLNYPDESFDIVLVHSGLHHLQCPAKGINQMYRVARIAVIGFEPNRNLFTTLGVRFGAGQQYECAAVINNEFRWGGVANTEVPNYVVRFNQGDIERIVQTYNPIGKHRIDFFYATRIPPISSEEKNKKFIRRAVATFSPILRRIGRYPMFANNMAFCIYKLKLPQDLFPWLELRDGKVTCNPATLKSKV